MSGRDWRREIPEAERQLYERAGFGGRAETWRRPALLVIDTTLDFTGSKGLTLEEAIAEFPTAAGPAAWEAMPRLSETLALFRRLGRPVVFTRMDPEAAAFVGRATTSRSQIDRASPLYNVFPEEIAPGAGEWVIEKTRPSAFFATPLCAYLVRRGVDSVFLCGVSTSGCVRATAVDAFSLGFGVVIVEDGVFDRSRFAHAASLFDMATKYGEVVPSASLGERARSWRTEDEANGA